ncbi:response regulator [Methanoplanus limicola]|uniref:Response regulator receiver protein n=1 Tax=Methanoplanus limicola DSM 2279 TaxID=937775 RepID=H1Z4K6_9EURY|nr:response regulator [Methanoplanus limicola]EHQ36754.1 response regulator receiver protein [Methanoplanus limicola DSM 2279]
MKRILVVEDEMIVAMAIKKSLKNLGYDIVGHSTRGEDAVLKAGELKPDLILMDIRLKGEMDGVDAAERIKSLYGIPVIFLTAHSDLDTMQRAIKAEPAGYLVKPFNERELHTNIEMSLYKSRIKSRVDERSTAGNADAIKSIRVLKEPVLATDKEFRIIGINQAFSEMAGVSESEAEGVFVPDIIVHSKKSVDGGNIVWPDQLNLRTGDSDEPVILNAGYMHNPDGEFSGLILHVQSKFPDDGEKNDQKNIYLQILEYDKYPVFIIDKSLNIIYYNSLFLDICRNIGISEYFLSRPVYEIPGFSVFGEIDDYRDTMRLKNPDFSVKLFKKGNDSLYIEFMRIPLLSDGKITHVAVRMTDITVERRYDDMEEDLEGRIDRLEFFIDGMMSSIKAMKNPVFEIMKRSASKDDSNLTEISDYNSDINVLVNKIEMKSLEFEELRKG